MFSNATSIETKPLLSRPLVSSWCFMLYPQIAEQKQILHRGQGNYGLLFVLISPPLGFTLIYKVKSLKYQILLWTKRT